MELVFKVLIFEDFYILCLILCTYKEASVPELLFSMAIICFHDNK